jgi:hypothetical protein
MNNNDSVVLTCADCSDYSQSRFRDSADGVLWMHECFATHPRRTIATIHSQGAPVQPEWCPKIIMPCGHPHSALVHDWDFYPGDQYEPGAVCTAYCGMCVPGTPSKQEE